MEFLNLPYSLHGIQAREPLGMRIVTIYLQTHPQSRINEADLCRQMIKSFKETIIPNSFLGKNVKEIPLLLDLPQWLNITEHRKYPQSQ